MADMNNIEENISEDSDNHKYHYIKCRNCGTYFICSYPHHKRQLCETCFSIRENNMLNKKTTTKICSNCKSQFISKYPFQSRKLCETCFKNREIINSQNKLRILNSSKRKCITCGVDFSIKYPHHTRKYCDSCILKHKKRRQNIILRKEDFEFCPSNEQEVVVLFFKIFKSLGFSKIKKIQIKYPDAYVIDNEGQEKSIEFEYLSSGYKSHLEEAKQADYIVCWIKDKEFENIKIIELKSIFI
jgi:hypothetical protein